MISTLAIGLALVGSCYGRSDAEVKGWFFTLAIACNKDYSISNEELAMLYDHKIPNTDDAKCMLHCIFQKANMMDEKGNYDLAKTNEWIAKEFSDDDARLEKAKHFFDLCKKVNDEPASDGEKGCDRAYLLGLCLAENSPKIPI